MLREKRRIGFFGGTFDPLHCGHIEMARAAAQHLQLHNVAFVPTRQNPLKADGPVASNEQRVEMIRIGIAQYARFSVWEGELNRDGPSYTLDTITHIERVYPNAHLFWIIGSDQMPHIHRWYGIETLVNKIGFILVQRPGYQYTWPGIKGMSLYPVENPLISVSSTAIRERVRKGESLEGWVPAGVEQYIARHGLYT